MALAGSDQDDGNRAASQLTRRWWGPLAGTYSWLADLFSLISLVLRHAPLAGALLALQSVIAGIATPLIVWAISHLIDSLVAAQSAGRSPWRGAAPWLSLLAVTFTVRALQQAATEYLVLRARRDVDGALQQQVFEQATTLPLATFEQPAYYAHLESGKPALQGAAVHATRNLTSLLAAAIGAVGLMALFAQASWLLALVLLATTVVRAAASARLSQAFGRINFETSPRRREIGYWSGVLAGREAAPELRLFGLGAFLVGRWRGAFKRYVAEVMAARRHHIVQVALVVTAQQAIGWLAIAVLLLLALRGALSTGALVGLLYGIERFGQVSGVLSYTTADLARHATHVAQLRQFLALPHEAPGRALPPPRPLRQEVRFEDASFTYPGAAQPAITGVNLLLRPGERVALVGENGAGKTTLVKLLLGLYRPTGGRITVGGVPLDQIDRAAWWREVTAVFQDFVRYPMTAAENVAVADVTLPADGAAHGCVVEEGHHEALLRAGGEYARLYSLQAAWYADASTTGGTDHGP